MPPTRSKSGGSGGVAKEAWQAAAAGASSAISRLKNDEVETTFFFFGLKRKREPPCSFSAPFQRGTFRLLGSEGGFRGGNRPSVLLQEKGT